MFTSIWIYDILENNGLYLKLWHFQAAGRMLTSTQFSFINLFSKFYCREEFIEQVWCNTSESYRIHVVGLRIFTINLILCLLINALIGFIWFIFDLFNSVIEVLPYSSTIQFYHTEPILHNDNLVYLLEILMLANNFCGIDTNFFLVILEFPGDRLSCHCAILALYGRTEFFNQ